MYCHSALQHSGYTSLIVVTAQVEIQFNTYRLQPHLFPQKPSSTMIAVLLSSALEILICNECGVAVFNGLIVERDTWRADIAIGFISPPHNCF